MTLNELPSSAKFARRVLKIILLPVVILVGITRFTPSQWYWLDIICVAFVLLAVILVVVGRVFTSKATHDEKGAANSQ